MYQQVDLLFFGNNFWQCDKITNLFYDEAYFIF